MWIAQTVALLFISIADQRYQILVILISLKFIYI